MYTIINNETFQQEQMKMFSLFTSSLKLCIWFYINYNLSKKSITLYKTIFWLEFALKIWNQVVYIIFHSKRPYYKKKEKKSIFKLILETLRLK